MRIVYMVIYVLVGIVGLARSVMRSRQSRDARLKRRYYTVNLALVVFGGHHTMARRRKFYMTRLSYVHARDIVHVYLESYIRPLYAMAGGFDVMVTDDTGYRSIKMFLDSEAEFFRNIKPEAREGI